MAASAQTTPVSSTITIDELATRLGVHRTTLYDQIREGALPWPVARIGRRIVISRKAFEAWENAQLSPTSPEAA